MESISSPETISSAKKISLILQLAKHKKVILILTSKCIFIGKNYSKQILNKTLQTYSVGIDIILLKLNKLNLQC